MCHGPPADGLPHLPGRRHTGELVRLVQASPLVLFWRCNVKVTVAEHWFEFNNCVITFVVLNAALILRNTLEIHMFVS